MVGMLWFLGLPLRISTSIRPALRNSLIKLLILYMIYMIFENRMMRYDIYPVEQRGGPWQNLHWTVTLSRTLRRTAPHHTTLH
jgi:hypothetical protein